MRDWDSETIRNQSITSLELMERAARQCVRWIVAHTPSGAAIGIVCGRGNNGGDGLAIARLLSHQQRNVRVFVVGDESDGSPDFLANLRQIGAVPVAALSKPKD